MPVASGTDSTATPSIGGQVDHSSYERKTCIFTGGPSHTQVQHRTERIIAHVGSCQPSGPSSMMEQLPVTSRDQSDGSPANVSSMSGPAGPPALADCLAWRIIRGAKRPSQASETLKNSNDAEKIRFLNEIDGRICLRLGGEQAQIRKAPTTLVDPNPDSSRGLTGRGKLNLYLTGRGATGNVAGIDRALHVDGVDCLVE